MIKSSTQDIQSLLKLVTTNIERAIKESGQAPRNVRLVAVSKTKPVELIKEAYDCGVRDFGENYVDELLEKYDKLPNDIRWHFIGHLQSNKCKQILTPPNLTFIETVDSIKLADKLDKTCKKTGRANLNIMVQVRTSDEDSKSGAQGEELFSLIEHILTNCIYIK
eukprot:TRINITY_DN1075_c0_g1_i8.p1 TRINITY_DN1075_c0_g1~~TRINITY_DN1075_c0_g1_i8.p1  ORF type:complete len:165 (+),score=34.89 TRINITY_DN1075_c0_g1_i8:65-559(+)